MTLPATRQVSRAELGDRLFVVGGKLLWLCLLGVAVLMPLLAIFWRGFKPGRAVAWSLHEHCWVAPTSTGYWATA